jgi:hypothetical protein
MFSKIRDGGVWQEMGVCDVRRCELLYWQLGFNMANWIVVKLYRLLKEVFFGLILFMIRPILDLLVVSLQTATPICYSISTHARYMTLQKYLSHPSLVIYFFATPPIRASPPMLSIWPCKNICHIQVYLFTFLQPHL